MIVLDVALNAMTSKFSTTLARMKPVFNKLLDLSLNNPCDTNQKKLLAFKKSLLGFETW
jgi:hypothetical protein